MEIECVLESGTPVRHVTMLESARTDGKSRPSVLLRGGPLLTIAREKKRSTVRELFVTTFAQSER